MPLARIPRRVLKSLVLPQNLRSVPHSVYRGSTTPAGGICHRIMGIPASLHPVTGPVHWPCLPLRRHCWVQAFTSAVRRGMGAGRRLRAINASLGIAHPSLRGAVDDQSPFTFRPCRPFLARGDALASKVKTAEHRLSAGAVNPRFCRDSLELVASRGISFGIGLDKTSTFLNGRRQATVSVNRLGIAPPGIKLTTARVGPSVTDWHDRAAPPGGLGIQLFPGTAESRRGGAARLGPWALLAPTFWRGWIHQSDGARGHYK